MRHCHADLSLEVEVLGFRAEAELVPGVRSLPDQVAVDRVDEATAEPLSCGLAR
jgi:hypothetical protein